MTPQLTPGELSDIGELLAVAGSLISQQAILCDKTMSDATKKEAEVNADRAHQLSRKVFDIIAAGRYPRFDALGNLPKDTVIDWGGERCVVVTPFSPDSPLISAVTIERPEHGSHQLPGSFIVYVYGMKKG